MTSRRTFIKLSALGVGSVYAHAGTKAPDSGGDGRSIVSPSQSDIAVWSTDASRRFAKSNPLQWRTDTKPTSPDALQLVPNNQFQEILGFGGCFSDAACSVIHELKNPLREQLLHELFHPSEMNLSVNRTCVGAADSAATLYSYDE